MKINQLNFYNRNSMSFAGEFFINQDGMLERDIVVNNEHGIHCRPATSIMQYMKKNNPADVDIFVLTPESGEKVAVNNSILALLMLALGKGHKAKIIAPRDLTEDAFNKIADSFELYHDSDFDKLNK